MLDENLDTALDVLSDMILRPKLAESDIALEKNVVYEEIAMSEDSPADMVHELVMEAAWGKAVSYTHLGLKFRFGVAR